MATPAAVRAWEAQFQLYRTVWFSNVLGSFVQPMLYLLGMGLGVGALVSQRENATDMLGGLTYFQYLAPALLATTAMMVMANEALWPLLGGFEWERTFFAQASTPLTPPQIARGLALWHATKVFFAATGVGAVLLIFPSTRTWGVFPAVGCAVLTGMAFSAMLSWYSSTRKSDQTFPVIMRYVITPMFLFSGAFYPVEQLPGVLPQVAKFTPLWHGVELCRNAVHATLTPSAVAVHVAVLMVFIGIGQWGTMRAFGRRLYV